MGRAIVPTDARGCRQTVTKGRNGLLVPPRDPGALAAAILQVARNRPFLVAVGAGGPGTGARPFEVYAANAEILAIVDGH